MLRPYLTYVTVNPAEAGSHVRHASSREPDTAASRWPQSDYRIGEDVLHVVGGVRDDVDGDELADAPRGGRTRVGGGLHRSHVAADDRGDQARVDFLPADEDDVGGLQHRVSRLDHADQPDRLDHAERLAGEHSLRRHRVLGCRHGR